MISHARRKAKGSSFERELIHKFWAAGWGATRIAGSGSIRHPAPDLIAGRPGRFIAIEAKTCDDVRKYLSVQEVDDLLVFSAAIGAEAWIAVKFKGKGTFLFSASQAKRTEKSVVVSREDLGAFEFDEFVQ